MKTLRSILTSSWSVVSAWGQKVDLKTSISSKLVSSWGGIYRLTHTLTRQRFPVVHEASNPQSIDVILGQGRKIKHSGSVNFATRGFPYKTTSSLVVLGGYAVMGYALSNIQDMLQEGKESANIQLEYIRGIKYMFPDAINHSPEDTIRESLEYNMSHDNRGITFVYGPSGTGKTTTIIRAIDDLIHGYKGSGDNVSDTADISVPGRIEAASHPIRTNCTTKDTNSKSLETSKQKQEKETGAQSSEPDQKYRLIIVDLKRFDEIRVQRSARRLLFECAYHYYESLLPTKAVQWWAWLLLPCRLFFPLNNGIPWYEAIFNNFKRIFPTTSDEKRICVEETYHMLEVAKKLYSYHLIPNQDATVIDQEISNSSSVVGLLSGLLSAGHAPQDIQYFPSLFTCAMDMLRQTSSSDNPTILTILDSQNVALLRRFGKVGDEKALELSSTDLFWSIARNILDFFSNPSSNLSHMQLVIETSDCAAGLAFLDIQTHPIVKVLVDGWWKKEYEDVNEPSEKHVLLDKYAVEMACNIYCWLRCKSHKLCFPRDRDRKALETKKRKIFDELNEEEQEYFKNEIKTVYERVGLHASDWFAFAWHLARKGVGDKALLGTSQFMKDMNESISKANRTIHEQAVLDVSKAQRTYCVYTRTMNWTNEKDTKSYASNGSMWGLRRMSNAGEHFLPYREDCATCSLKKFIRAIDHAEEITRMSKTLSEAEDLLDEEEKGHISTSFSGLLMSPEAMGFSRAGLFAIFPTTADIGELFRLQRPSLQRCVDMLRKQYDIEERNRRSTSSISEYLLPIVLISSATISLLKNVSSPIQP